MVRVKHILLLILSLILGVLVSMRPQPLPAETNPPRKPEPAYTMNLAALAPEGTSWSDTALRFKQYVETKSGGKIQVLWFLGGIMGDEPEVLRKIRAGELQGAGFTNVGLGIIAPETRILGLPFLFQSYEEVDFYLEKMNPHFQYFFEQRGYILAGWLENGFNYWFTQKPVQTLEDFPRHKMWAWVEDPVNTETNKAIGFQNVPVSFIEVLSGLLSSEIDSFYGPLYAITGLQWYTMAKCLVDLPFSYTPAAIVLDKKFMDGLPRELQRVVLDAWGDYLPPLVRQIRKDNEQIYRGFPSKGIKPVPLDAAMVKALHEKTAGIPEKFVDRLYPLWLLTQTLASLEEFRRKEGGLSL